MFKWGISYFFFFILSYIKGLMVRHISKNGIKMLNIGEDRHTLQSPELGILRPINF